MDAMSRLVRPGYAGSFLDKLYKQDLACRSRGLNYEHSSSLLCDDAIFREGCFIYLKLGSHKKAYDLTDRQIMPQESTLDDNVISWNSTAWARSQSVLRNTWRSTSWDVDRYEVCGEQRQHKNPRYPHWEMTSSAAQGTL